MKSVTTEDLRKICQIENELEKRDVIWFAPALRLVSIYLSRWFISTGITPNQISLLSAGVGILGGVCFALGSGWPSIIGSLLLIVGAVLDCCDGEVARGKGMCSLTGHTFDIFAQLIIFVAAVCGISIACLQELGSLWGIIGFLTAILFLLSSNLSLLKNSVAVDAKLARTTTLIGQPPRQATQGGLNHNPNLSVIKGIIQEFLKIPNQKLFFLAVSILDTVNIPKPRILQWPLTYIGFYMLGLSMVVTIVFFTKIYVLAQDMETDKIFYKIK
jgi:phosphatidylglycerophosphate synthase